MQSRNLIVFCFNLLCCTYSFAQGNSIPHVPLKNDIITFEFIDSSIQLTKADFFIKAKQWAVKNFKNSKEVIQSEDPEAGKIIIKANGLVPTSLVLAPIERMEFTIDISCRDGKYRVQVYDLIGYPQIVTSLRISAENLYNRCISKVDDDNLSKKQRKFQQEQKEKACATIENIIKYVESINRSIRAEMTMKDEF